MIAALDITFFAGFALFALAGALAYLYVRRESPPMLTAVYRVLSVGAAALLIVFFLRWLMFGLIPLTTPVDALNLLILLSTFIVLAVARQGSVRTLLCFYAPALLLVYGCNAVAGYGQLHSEPKELNGLFLAIHVGLAFLAYALFFVASLTSMAYIIQSRNLKRLRTTGIASKLPALEHLDGTLYRLIQYGYPFFVITLVLGLIGTVQFSEELNPTWWFSPKILRAVFSALMVILYAAAFHTRRIGWLRGQKLAYLVLIGSSIILGMYMLVGLAGVEGYRFWGKSA